MPSDSGGEAAGQAQFIASGGDHRVGGIGDLILRRKPRTNLFPQHVAADLAGGGLRDLGELDHRTRALNVAVLTPGFNSTFDGSLQNYDRRLADMRNISNRLQLANGETASTATVTWLGYQAPQTDSIPDLTGNSVASPLAAERGAENLGHFLEGIDAVRPGGEPHLTAIGHSYGSTTTGFALERTDSVNDAVLLGSPGFGAQVPASLNVDGGKMYAGWAEGDQVPLLNAGHTLGASPYAHPEEFQRFATGASDSGIGQLQSSYGHSEYFKNHSTSQYNIAAIISGHAELIQK